MSEFKGYESLTDFINSENPVEYDFKYQIGQVIPHLTKPSAIKVSNFVLNEENNIKRLLFYKMLKFCGSRFDCDGSAIKGTNEKYFCKLSREIYRKFWDFNDDINKNRTIKNNYGLVSGFDIEFGPDTLNSFITSYENNTSNNVTFKNFAVLTHTIGNFTLVPRMEDKFEKGFNSYRGLHYGDYWDISLQHLLSKGFKNDETKFREYIDTFFIWDYVDEKYNPLSLFMNHSDFTKRTSCKSDIKRDNYQNFLDNVEYAIKRRGKFMVYMLCNIEEYNDFKSKTSLEKVKKYNVVINNFDDWFHNYRLKK